MTSYDSTCDAHDTTRANLIGIYILLKLGQTCFEREKYKISRLLTYHHRRPEYSRAAKVPY